MRKPKHHHSDRDKIFTPEDLAIKLIKKIPAKDGDSWCDPCYGKGVFYNNFPNIWTSPPEEKDFYEIDMGKDYLTSLKSYDWNVTNIPFSKPNEFIFHMAEHSVKGFGILCLANSMTATRLKKLEAMGFYMDSLTVIYIKSWGFGYRTDFYVFTRGRNNKLQTLIYE